MKAKINHTLLKRDWLDFAEKAKAHAELWRKGANGWPMEDCTEEAEKCMKSYDSYIERSKTAPIKVVMFFEDGTEQVYE